MLKTLLQEKLVTAGLVVPNAVQEQFVTYLQQLVRWNRVHNLTGISDPVEMIETHVIDSLSLLPYLPKGRIIDIGTGAGLPGIPLALMWPEGEFVLLDSNQKKIAFVEHMVLTLPLPHVRVVSQRAEKYVPEKPFDLVISRAFGSLAEFIRVSRHLGQKKGKLIAMKGKLSSEELSAVPSGYQLDTIESSVGKSRSLVVITPNSIEGENR